MQERLATGSAVLTLLGDLRVMIWYHLYLPTLSGSSPKKCKAEPQQASYDKKNAARDDATNITCVYDRIHTTSVLLTHDSHISSLLRKIDCIET